MKKDTLRWGIGIGIVFVLYTLAAFLIPFVHTAVFWVSVAFTFVAFGVVAAAIYTAFVKNPDAKSRFYGFPIARIGVIYGAVQLAVGILFMALAAILPVWAVVLVCSILMGSAVIGLISAEAVVEEIHVQDVKLKKDVSLMRGLQSKVHMMAAQCDHPDAADAVKALAEELRYSDPVSSEAIAEIEAELCAAVDVLQAAIADGDSNAAKQICRRASGILAERNRLCKLSKQAENPMVATVKVEKEVVHSNTTKIVALVALALCGVVVLVLLLNLAILPNIRYAKAVKLMEKGNALEAYDALMAMDGYRDSTEKARSIYDLYKLEKLKTAVVGDCVPLGTYEQDGDSSNGKEDILWYVLDKKEGRLLLISKFSLDVQPYNEFDGDITWEASTLRKWLNNGFINTAFSEAEKANIPAVPVSTERNPVYDTEAGLDTEDCVFLLSAEEVSRYFSNHSDRVCHQAGTTREIRWWLRNPGQSQLTASLVDGSGAVDAAGAEAARNDIGVRPALWVSLPK